MAHPVKIVEMMPSSVRVRSFALLAELFIPGINLAIVASGSGRSNPCVLINLAA